MFDVLLTLCLLDQPGLCAERTIPTAAATCPEALAAAAGRIEGWRARHAVSAIRCGSMAVSPLPFEEVRPGLHVHRAAIALADPVNGGTIGNIAFVVGETGVAVIDSGGSRAAGEAVVAAVRAVTDRPIRLVVLTHAHPDHVFGATALADAGATIWAHHALPEVLALRMGTFEAQGLRLIGADFVGTEAPRVDHAVQGSAAVDAGGRTLELRAWPVAHSGADLTVLDPAAATLLAGDLVFDRHLPTLDGSLRGWQRVLEDLQGLEAEWVVPGHGGPLLPWPEGLEPTERYLARLGADVRELIAGGATLSEAAARAAEAERGAWLLFDEHNPRNATVAYTELEWE